MALTDVGRNLMIDGITGTAVTPFNNANSRIGVGNSTTVFAANQTDLQAAAGASNQQKNTMDATYPTRATNVLTFRATFATTEANFAWNEWGIFNAASGANSMLSRKVESLGTKPSSQTWQFTATLTITTA